MLSHLLANTPDISGVPADFVRNFLLCAGFFVVIGLQVLSQITARRRASGQAGDPVAIQQPLQVQEVVEHALADDVERVEGVVGQVESDVDALRKELAATRVEIATTHTNIIKHVDAKTDAIRAQVESSINRLHSRMDDILRVRATGK